MPYDDYKLEQAEEERARVFNLACDAEGVPKKERASARKEHWSSVVRVAIPPRLPGASYGVGHVLDTRHIVWMFGRVGLEGRKTAEAAARLGGWKAVVDFVAAGRGAQELIASAYVLGGGDGVRAVVRQLALPGVWVNEFGAVCWVESARAADVGLSA